jgi:hypothetical protein
MISIDNNCIAEVRRMKSWIIGVGFMLLSGAVQAQAWQLVKDEAGIKVYLQPAAGSNFQAFRAVTRMRTSLAQVLALQDDVSSACAWMHACSQQRLLEQQGNVSWIYSQFNAPWPVKPRDSIVRVATEFSVDGSVMRYLNEEAEYLPLPQGFVRVSQIKGFWQLKPYEGGVEVVYQVHSDPGGSVPAWLANSFVVDAPFNTLGGCRI